MRGHAATSLLVLAAAGCGTPDSVIQDLRSPNAFQQMRGINAIITAGDADDDALPLLARHLQSPLGEVSVRAAKALGSLGEKGVPALERALRSSDPEHRWKAALGLYSAGPAAAAAAPALIAALKDSDALVRQYTAMAIGMAGLREAIPALKARLADEEDPHAKEAMGWALHILGARPEVNAGPARVIERRGGPAEKP